jgi:hypothetical protein
MRGFENYLAFFEEIEEDSAFYTAIVLRIGAAIFFYNEIMKPKGESILGDSIFLSLVFIVIVYVLTSVIADFIGKFLPYLILFIALIMIIIFTVFILNEM